MQEKKEEKYYTRNRKIFGFFMIVILILLDFLLVKNFFAKANSCLFFPYDNNLIINNLKRVVNKYEDEGILDTNSKDYTFSKNDIQLKITSYGIDAIILFDEKHNIIDIRYSYLKWNLHNCIIFILLISSVYFITIITYDLIINFEKIFTYKKIESNKGNKDLS